MYFFNPGYRTAQAFLTPEGAGVFIEKLLLEY